MKPRWQRARVIALPDDAGTKGLVPPPVGTVLWVKAPPVDLQGEGDPEPERYLPTNYDWNGWCVGAPVTCLELLAEQPSDFAADVPVEPYPWGTAQ